MRHCLGLAAITVILTSSLVSAGSDASPSAVAVINTKLIRPLAAKDSKHSKFSRARLPPSERRVRVLDEKPNLDSSGESFYTFAVDTRRGWSLGELDGEENWSKAEITGCVYPRSGDVFIKRGNALHPAVAATGKKTKAAPSATCQGAAQLTRS